MKTIKFLIFALALTISTFVVTSCSKEESEDPLIVGTWVCVTESEYDKSKETETFTFDKNGSFVYQYKRIQEHGEDENFMETGRYTFKNNTLVLYCNDGEVETYDNVIITEYSLILDEDYTFIKR